MISFLLKLWHGDQTAWQQFDMWMNGLGEKEKPKEDLYITNGVDILFRIKKEKLAELIHKSEEEELQARLQSCRGWREGKKWKKVNMDDYRDCIRELSKR